MNKYFLELMIIFKITSDLFFLSFSWVVAFYIRFYSGLPIFKGIPDWNLYLHLIPIIWIIWGLVYSNKKIYSVKNLGASFFTEAANIFKSSLIATTIFISFTFFVEEYKYSRVTFLLFALLNPFFLIFGRYLQRNYFSKHRKRTGFLQKVVIIGGGAQLKSAIDLVQANNLLFGRLVAVIPLGENKEVEKDQKHFTQLGLRVDLVPKNWTDYLSTNDIGSAIIALTNTAYHYLADSISEIANQVSEIKIIPDITNFNKFSVQMNTIDQTPVLSINETSLKGIAIVQKRLLDIFGAIIALILFSPIILFCSFFIKLSSKGPVFYKQKRMGLDGRIFSIYKFRSMPVAAEAKTGAVFNSKNDSRATPFGKFIRRTSIDELPQLFNVLRGDMSLVGPRPERPIFVEKFRRNIPGYMLRHKTKAGMTGWAQINGWRGDTSIEKRIECDLFYIQNWSLWLDIKILFLTLFKGFVNPNAY